MIDLPTAIDIAEQRADKLSSEAAVLTGIQKLDELGYAQILRTEAARWSLFAELGKQLLKEFRQR